MRDLSRLDQLFDEYEQAHQALLSELATQLKACGQMKESACLNFGSIDLKLEEVRSGAFGHICEVHPGPLMYQLRITDDLVVRTDPLERWQLMRICNQPYPEEVTRD
ncbi:MAG: hypothetical protein CVV27_08460 [Candidatus Melainabacteria bacterium HGW-Melainabacteria-1]|nr:MAG: hypothetical protein CVV27_08460 [Candidatus Melainabacteria bacterium HGW-Melainabacteria-1]